MKYLHKNSQRGHFDFDWLKTAHSFSFGEYFNPSKMGFGTLRVINDDIISPGQGFGTHPHNNMEIITIPFKGSLEHKDSLGNSEVIETGEVQAMSAGSGVLHSEYNPSHILETQLFQIWIQTKALDISPQYNQKLFSQEDRINKFQLLVSPNKSDEVVFINQDAYISRVYLEKGNTINYKKYSQENGIYMILISGEAEIQDEILYSKDAIGFDTENNIQFTSTQQNSDILILEVPMK